MKSISFYNERTYIRENVRKIEIDDTDLHFEDGLAVAKAKVSCFAIERNAAGYNPKTSVYFCEGIINDKYAEAFTAKYQTDMGKYLIFCKENKHIKIWI